MSDPRLTLALRELGLAEFVTQADQAALARQIASRLTPDIAQAQPERLPRLAFLFETQGLIAFENRLGEDETAQPAVRGKFGQAFACWRSLISLPESPDGRPPERASVIGLHHFHTQLPDDPMPRDLGLAFRVAVTGLLAERSAETRLELRRFDIPPHERPRDWRGHVIHRLFSAFVLLTRKDGGWNDVEQAIHMLHDLRSLQAEFEATYLDTQGEESEQTVAAVELVGLYNLAQLVSVTGEYLCTGVGGSAQTVMKLDRFHDRGKSAFASARSDLLAHLADLLWAGCQALVSNTIWTHVEGLGEGVKEFARLLAAKGQPSPVLELWPSQQSALGNSLLDVYKRSILVQMPTSAGKTLLAKFVIVQTKALNAHGTIAYIVPTRALVNQVTLELRSDFKPLGYRVEQAVPAFELDPAEEQFLDDPPDILVTTPEKLDLLVRRDHTATRNLTLVIADEAHNIRDKNRGPRLELLLGTIKRDRADARFLLLSPFLPNPDELVRWLGDSRHLPPISVNWQPARKLLGAVTTTGRGREKALTFESLPAVGNDLAPGVTFAIGTPSDNTITALSKATVHAMRQRGSVLILCRGPGTAVKRALELAGELPSVPLTPELDAVCRYLEAEIGRSSGLVTCLRHGVAYHHSGLSHEARWLIESLIRKKMVSIVCGTTTLAQGVNFPIATVIMETLDKGTEKLSHEDFWNIAGRAGRTLVDTVGTVAFPAPDAAKKREYVRFLQSEAREIASQLATLIDQVEVIGDNFSLQTLRDFPQLSSLLQFLSHAMRISGTADVADEVEDILRASLVYHQARRLGDGADRKLVQLCRNYLNKVRGRRDILAMADQTGFATPSVLKLLAEKGENPEFSVVETWRPENLFGNDIEPLSRRIQAIANIPEISLGQGTGQPFSPERVASILRDWVRGDTLADMAENHLASAETDPDRRVAEFSKYLFSNLLGASSWGLGALEGVCLAGRDRNTREAANYIPSMVFFGVQKREAVWLRMVGVPRIVADNLAGMWEARGGKEPQSYNDIRNWVSGLADDAWARAIPAGSDLTPDHLRRIWREFAE